MDEAYLLLFINPAYSGDRSIESLQHESLQQVEHVSGVIVQFSANEFESVFPGDDLGVRPRLLKHFHVLDQRRRRADDDRLESSCGQITNDVQHIWAEPLYVAARRRCDKISSIPEDPLAAPSLRPIGDTVPATEAPPRLPPWACCES